MTMIRDITLHLASADLLQQKLFVAGAWRSGRGREPLIVRNPANAETICAVDQASPEDVEAALVGAKAAFPKWRQLLAKDRGAVLARWAALMRAHREDLASILTHEQGKPLAEARGEIDYAAGFLGWYAAEAERINGELLQPHKPGRRMLVLREPVGVTAAITPWNFPAAMVTRKAGAALAAGCTMIVRPASETPLSALALAALADQAGVPAGVFSVLVGDGRAIAAALATSEDVRALSFTGSTEIGRILLRQCSYTVKKVSMELGGHAPFIAFDDCNLAKAVGDAVTAKFATTGQDCLAANRILIQESIYEQFCDEFAARTARLRVGYGWHDGVDQGPLINARAVAKCEAQVTDALAKGARVICGGERHELGGNFFQPTVLVDVTPDMDIFHQETFGPVAAIASFNSESDALALANDTQYGLAAYLYTIDAGRMWRFGEALEYGMIGVNTPSFTGPPIPFGGCKQSGLGREGGRYGVEDFLETKYLCIDVA